MPKASRYDLVIVGGGPVGMTLAASLMQFVPGLKLAVLDRRPFAIPDDARASALAAGVGRILEGLGLWADVAAEAVPIARMRITDSGRGDMARPLFLSFEGDVVPGRPYAHMLANSVLAKALMARLDGQAELMGSVEIANWETGPAFGRLTLKDGRVLEAPLTIAADGAQSAMRAMAGISTFGHAYGQSGLVTTITHELDHDQTAWEHFRPAGPFASLPLAGKSSSLVFTETTDEAARLKLLPPDELALVIERAMGSVLGEVALADRVQVFPLKLQIAKSFHGTRLALIGDAAHVVHPIAGQGLNLGLKDVAALSEILVSAFRLGRDHGAEDVLADYTAWRRFDTALMAMVTDALTRLFSNDVAPVRALRDLGMGIVDRVPIVKSALIRHAAAVGGGEPKLMRGLPI